jgi:hypothetical protein
VGRGGERGLPFISTMLFIGSLPFISCTSPSGKTMKYSFVNIGTAYPNLYNPARDLKYYISV